MNIFLFIGFITIGVVRSQDFGCPPTGVHAIAYPFSCRRFVRCINGNGIVQECAPGLSFDIVLGTCNTQEQANCNPCRANAAHEITFTRDPFNCARFTMCIGAVVSENTCAQGLYFDTTLNTCARSETVYCPGSDGGGTTTTTASPPGDDLPLPPGREGTCDLEANFETIASPISCERHIICACGEPNIRNCPPGLIFDVVTLQCNTRAQGHCLSESMPTCPATTVEQIAHPFDCRHLVLCILGSPQLEACAPGLEVNRKTNKCDFKHIAQCSSQEALTYTQLMSGMVYI